jgi:hypothetical protein
MFPKTKIALSAAVILGTASAALAGGVPSIDIEKMCRASEAALFGPDNSASTFHVCMSDEQAAREQLVKDWANLPPTHKAHCVLPAEYLPSYVEWLTCLEMEGDVTKIRGEQCDEQSAPVSPGLNEDNETLVPIQVPPSAKGASGAAPGEPRQSTTQSPARE